MYHSDDLVQFLQWLRHDEHPCAIPDSNVTVRLVSKQHNSFDHGQDLRSSQEILIIHASPLTNTLQAVTSVYSTEITTLQVEKHAL